MLKKNILNLYENCMIKCCTNNEEKCNFFKKDDILLKMVFPEDLFK